MGTIEAYSVAAGKRYRVRYRSPDRRQRARQGFKTKKDAQLYLASVEVDVARGAFIDPNLSRVLLSDWLRRWLAGRADLRPSSRDRAEGIIRRNIEPDLGAIAIGELTRSRVQEWAGGLSAGQSPASVRKIVNVLSGAIQYAVDDGRLAANPASKLKLPRVAKVSKKYLTHQQVHDLAAAVDRRWSGYGALIQVLAYCGLRWGELAGLRVGDIDMSLRRLKVRQTMVEVNGLMEPGKPKTYEERSVPLPHFLLDALEPWTNRPASAPLFPGVRSGGPLRNRAFRRGAFDEAATEIGLTGLVPHEMRHTCASLAVSGGASVKGVQRLLGHASAAETLDTYADLFDSDLDDVAARFDQVVKSSVVHEMCTKGVLETSDEVESSV